ncbi:MAG: arylsulfatase [Bryobacteraceae bacterium]
MNQIGPFRILCFALGILSGMPIIAQESLPFPPTPSASTAGRTLQDSIHKWRIEPRRLPADAPNILIILLDDTGPGLPSTYGGEIHTPTLDRVAKAGVSYNGFHSTAMCSPTRAALLTGRNHTRVGNGQIAEIANDWDGFTGYIPKSSATVAEVLRDYGYNTSAFGKWHLTGALETSSLGPFNHWPTAYGFEYFYGFLPGEASQYEPQLVKNTTVLDPHGYIHKGYHLSEDLADNAIVWLREQRAFSSEKPWLMYWAPGASHGPHQVPPEWADKYKGKFDDGWDKYRERVFQRQKDLGWIPSNTQLTPRPDTLASWNSIPESEKPFQRRLMELFAGFTEHVDFQAGRVIEEIDNLGELDNTLIFYIWGDNGSSAEGYVGSISELLAQNQIPNTISQQMKALDGLGGLDALGTAKTDNMYHAGWGWAGSTPFKGTKLLASYFGGTRQPMAVSWPKKIKADTMPRSQFLHVNDIAPTIYEVLNITPPRLVSGVPQDPIDGVSFVYTFNDATAKERKLTQFFDVMGSRGIYHDGWFASAMGPRIPWLVVTPGMATWTPDRDKWELYNIREDFSQANDLAGKMPGKVQEMKELFLIEAAKNKDLPIGGGLYVLFHPGDMLQSQLTEWTFPGAITRMPEFSAPKLGTRSNTVTIDADVPANASGVLYALGGFSGGLATYMQEGTLCYEYNLFEIERTKVCSAEKLPPGRARISVETLTKPKPMPGGAKSPYQTADIVIRVNDKEVAQVAVPLLATLIFTANDCLDFGTDLGSPVALDYFDKAPFPFTGKILGAKVKYGQAAAPNVVGDTD